ncbi:hypothetical protein STHU_40620 [Allostella humosa]|uniref:phosphoribosyltransferase n=1 Tax=Stella humosa TaxID=94 RepID=UPI0011365704|nr:phosphoribosyltransferase [Stella humosa]BBK33428.1 hypothetical protein STHU_40620 [Stella humosa]
MGGEQSGLAAQLLWRPALRHRGGFAYLTVRSWRASTRIEDLADFRREKRLKRPELIGLAADEVAGELAALLQPRPPWIVTAVAPGHSRERLSWAVLLAIAVAERLKLPFVELFHTRPVNGSSHPRQNLALPPLEWAATPANPAIVVDDVATSGWHMAEALGALRDCGIPAIGAAWIAGIVRGRPE